MAKSESKKPSSSKNKIPSRVKIDSTVVPHPNPDENKTVPLRRAIAIKHNTRRKAEQNEELIPYWALKTDHKQVHRGEFMGHARFPNVRFKAVEDEHGKKKWIKFSKRKHGFVRETTLGELSTSSPDFNAR